ncbi:EVE domain-containing protein [bacterium]|nr:EVE domain-containing protein [bacterium]
MTIADSKQDILSFVKSYQRDTTFTERIRSQLSEFKQLHPRDAWGRMALGDYVVGGGDRSGYCYDLEFGFNELGGIRGASARKFGIYRMSGGEIWFDSSLGMTADKAWETLRAAYLQMFELADAGNWNEIDEIQALSNLPMVSLKTLHIYYPNHILPVYARDAIYHFLLKLDPQTRLKRNYDVVTLNRELLRQIREIDPLKDWETWEVVKMLYEWSDPREAERIMKIAPGEKAKYWNACLSGGYICVGWDEMGDLAEYASKEEFRERFEHYFLETYNKKKNAVVRKGNELWRLMELQPGDIVVANQGISKILAIGVVQEPAYQWRPERQEYKHTVNVSWDVSKQQDIEPQKRWGVTTVLELSPEELIRIQTATPTTTPAPTPLPTGPMYLRMLRELERTGQIVLYGPPGTGKTYVARRFAAWWLSKRAGKDVGVQDLDGDRLTALEKRLKSSSAGRVWWMVASPANGSWDDFFKQGSVLFTVGRLKRNFPMVQMGDLVIGYESTPVKKIVAISRVTSGLSAETSEEQGITLEPIAQLHNGFTYEELLQDAVLKDSEPMRFRNQGTLFSLTSDEAEYLLATLLERNPEMQNVMTGEEDVAQLTWLTFHPSYSYEDFIEGYRPVPSASGGMQLRLEDGVFKRICREALANPSKPYLVCIDEVNRSNIAKVLGELVTLLEKDKRGMEVVLPQSKERFTIPPNVYLVCTMNTADRSIKLLDAAVRRRFSFLEVMPDLDLLEGVEIDGMVLQDFLAELNVRIAKREGREKLIGHSYFLKDGTAITSKSEFCDRVRHDILPLLEEYCYDDIEALAELLGSGIIDADANTIAENVIEDEEQFFSAILEGFSNHD